MLDGFCIFKIKEAENRQWRTPPREKGLGTVKDEDQTIVFIALQDLGRLNGFFMSLDRGKDVCVDSKANILFPPSGGGIGVYIALNL